MREIGEALERIAAAARAGRSIALFLDFDGTVSPIVKEPSAAKPAAKTLSLLRRLAPHAQIIIISGRELADVASRIPLPGAWYAGDHGFDMRIGGEAVSADVPPPMRQALARALKELEDALARAPGIVVERKRTTFSMHFRNATERNAKEALRIAQAVLAPYIKEGTLASNVGKKVLEVRPNIRWDKGEAALLMLQRIPEPFPVAIGDDTTDEDMFRALREGVTVRIGKEPDSMAEYALLNRAALDGFLERVLAAFTAGGRAGSPR